MFIVPLFQGMNLLKSLKRGSGNIDDRYLTMREKTLMKRRKEAERLLQWKRKLDEEEKKVQKMGVKRGKSLKG